MNWRRFFARKTADAEQRQELEFYLDLTAEEYMARGMDPAAAKTAACKKLGNTTLIREDIYRINTLTWMEGLLRDVRHALRMIRTQPGFSVPALLSLALGIGANIAIFSVVNAVLIRPLNYPAPEKLVSVVNSAVISGQVFKELPLSLEMYPAYEESAQSFQEFGVWTPGEATVTGVGSPEQVPAVTMTAGVLRALEVRPCLGRWFSNADSQPGAQKRLIVSYAYWQRKLGADPHVLGRLVFIDSVPRLVIGVMPRTFEFLNLMPDVLLPQTLAGFRPGSYELNQVGIARLKPGVSVAQANGEIGRVLHAWSARVGSEQS